MSPIRQPIPKKRKLDESAAALPPHYDIPKPAALTTPLELDPLKSPNEAIADFIKLQKHSRKVVASVTEFAEQIKDTLSKTKTLRFSSLNEAEASFRRNKIQIPYLESTDDIHDGQEISFSSPIQIKMGAGLNHGLLLKSKDKPPLADLIVRIPPDLLRPKDYLEYRYTRKRALYLSYLALSLVQNTKGGDVSYFYEFLDGDELRPIVLITSLRRNCVLRLIPAITPNDFPLQKLSPSACRADRKIGIPTPQYNSSIIADAYHIENAELQRTAAISHSGFEGGIVLGSVWLSRQGYSSHILNGGFGDTEWILIQMHLVGAGDVPRLSSRQISSDPLQLFKSVLKVIANMGNGEPVSQHFPDPPGYSSKCYPPSYIRDGTSYNILFKMARWAYHALKREAHTVLSLGGIGISLRSQFKSIFLDTENRGYRDFDFVARLPIDNTNVAHQIIGSESTKRNIKRSTSDYCYDVLSYGLGDRCQSMTLFATLPTPQAVIGNSNGEISSCSRYNLDIYFLMDAKNAMRLMDHGPALENTNETAKFRNFWQDKAELRRFKDGRVVETVMWDPAPSVPGQIVNFLYQKITGGFSQNTPLLYGLGFDDFISRDLEANVDVHFSELISEFHMVANTIRGVDGFPLAFKEIRGTCPELRFASINPPFPCIQYLNCPYEAEIELESSSGWPSDPEQRRRSELGLLLRLRTVLHETKSFISLKVGFGHNTDDTQGSSFIDILTKNNYQFRFRFRSIQNDEFSTNNTRKNIHSITKITDLTLDPSISKSYQAKYNHANLILQKVKQNPFLSSTIRLVKIWFWTHHLGFYFTDEMLEIFGLVGFDLYSTGRGAGSAFCGFRRTINELSRWDWRRRYLEIESCRPFSDDEKLRLHQRPEYCQSYAGDSGYVGLSVAIAGDGGIIHCLTQIMPRLIAVRMTQLAREANTMLTNINTSPSDIFAPSMTYFDFLITLKPTFDPRKDLAKYVNLAIPPNRINTKLLYRDFLGDLEALAGHYILFLPSSDFSVIGCIWKPMGSGTGNSVPVIDEIQPPEKDHESDKIELYYNKPAILNMLKVLGEEYIDSIYNRL
ncbi:hypothetical protein H072_5866 [Dactylellina haptotyla CBS 200.50]|uniref:U3 small nucleolar RNA-associated protein 22 n=1 Tax=Dactylellina haptotyla (strain CBS 200.50) TaxID=1284197 RepID=S8BYB9_DACHA|nr:hypothetical protein H072_5866 [Dactylellina haptotyla CBS 200.50]